MKTERQKLLVTILLCGFIVGVSAVPFSAQDAHLFSPDSNKYAPADEEFTSAADLVGSWQGCSHMPDERPEHGCSKDEYSTEFMKAQNFTLYDRGGTVWWYASRLGDVKYREPRTPWFFENKKAGFQPLFDANGRDIVLRMVGESPNWYEVEINEGTRETKFVSKTDPAWSRMTWEIWLVFSGPLKLLTEQPLRDVPDGEVIAASNEIAPKRVTIVNVDGDWALVENWEVTNPGLEKRKGWIKWREGRKLLVGCFLQRSNDCKK